MFKFTVRIHLVFIPILLLIPINTYSVSFGVYDARSFAMGGAGVAVGEERQAQYYNPALLGFEDELEEDSLNGRFTFPDLVVQYTSGSFNEAEAILDEDYEEQLTGAIDAFNANPSADNARAVSAISVRLRTDIRRFQGEDVYGDLYLGLLVSEPADSEGGSFFFGVRTLGFAENNISSEDIQLVTDYINTLDFIASDGEEGEFNPELFDENGNLIDTLDNLTSTANVSGLAIFEWGIAAAAASEYRNFIFSVGITPKFKRTEVYSEQIEIPELDVSYEENSENFHSLNFDLGFVAEYKNNFRLGLTIKDALTESFTTPQNVKIDITPRARLGLAYISKYLDIGFDYDITKNDFTVANLQSQEMAIGFDLKLLKNLHLRAGYRDNAHDELAGIFTYGASLHIGRIFSEFSLMQNPEQFGASFNLGVTF